MAVKTLKMTRGLGCLDIPVIDYNEKKVKKPITDDRGIIYQAIFSNILCMKLVAANLNSKLLHFERKLNRVEVTQ